MIEYLDIDETYYIENDDIKFHLREDQLDRSGTWDDMKRDVVKILKCMKEYDERHNHGNIEG